MILGFPRAKPGLCHDYDIWGSGGYHFVSIAHSISSFQFAEIYFVNIFFGYLSHSLTGDLMLWVWSPLLSIEIFFQELLGQSTPICIV